MGNHIAVLPELPLAVQSAKKLDGRQSKAQPSTGVKEGNRAGPLEQSIDKIIMDCYEFHSQESDKEVLRKVRPKHPTASGNFVLEVIHAVQKVRRRERRREPKAKVGSRVPSGGYPVQDQAIQVEAEEIDAEELVALEEEMNSSPNMDFDNPPDYIYLEFPEGSDW